MNQFSFSYLLKQLIFKKINPDEFHSLKEKTIQATDNELDTELVRAWNEMKSVSPMDPDIKSEVLKNIHSRISPPSDRHSFRWARIAAAILFPVLLALGTYFYFSSSYGASPEKFVVIADSGQKTQVLLPDGTHVWLNSQSRLVYYSDFNKNNRKVELEGEAFFDVTKNQNSKFIVGTSTIDITVLGTAFNVSAYNEDESIDVTLLRGKVSVSDKASDQAFVELQPDHTVSVLKKNKQWTVTKCDAQIESLWIQNKLKFENASSAEIFRKLERWYGMNICVENPDTTIRYGFTLKSESLREILDLINKITPITYRVNGEEVYIRYK